jgi:hypothetical protein
MLVHEWDTRRFLPDRNLDHQDKEKFLCILAGHMQGAEEGLAGNLIDRSTLVTELRKYLDGLSIGDSYNKARELVVQLTERNFILAFAGAERFAFVHRTFLEYFCASWFFDQLCISKRLSAEQFCEQVLDHHVDDPSWREVLCLLVGMLGEGDAEIIIRWIMRPGENLVAHAVLAARCLNEVRSRTALSILDRDAFENMKAALKDERQELELPIDVTEADLEEYELRLPRMFSYDKYETVAVVWPTAETFEFLRNAVEDDQRFVMGSEVLSVIARQWPDQPDTKELLFRCLTSTDDGLRKSAFWNLTIRYDHEQILSKELVERVMDDPSETLQIVGFDYYVIRFVSEGTKVSFLKNSVLSDRHREVRLNVLEKYCNLLPETDLIEIYRDLAMSDSYWMIREKSIRGFASLTRYGTEAQEMLTRVLGSSGSQHD